MATDLGVKYTCFKCGTKFYDMKRPIPLCPKCGADQRESPPPEQPVVERKRPRSKTPAEVEATPADSDVPSLREDEEEDEPEADIVSEEAFDEEP